MSEKRFTLNMMKKPSEIEMDGKMISKYDVVRLLNEQQVVISKLEEEKDYWKSKAMTLLMQVRRLTPRMSAKEVIEFSKELEDE